MADGIRHISAEREFPINAAGEREGGLGGARFFILHAEDLLKICSHLLRGLYRYSSSEGRN